jgi:hypothetical protein
MSQSKPPLALVRAGSGRYLDQNVGGLPFPSGTSIRSNLGRVMEGSSDLQPMVRRVDSSRLHENSQCLSIKIVSNCFF